MKIQHANLGERVAERIKRMILDHKFSPGEKLPQEQLSQELGISRTPLLHALASLQAQGLVESISRRGFYIRKMTDEEMVFIHEIRAALEGIAARELAPNITEDQINYLKDLFKDFDSVADSATLRAYEEADKKFHRFIINSSPNKFLQEIVEKHSILFALCYQRGLLTPPQETLPQHQAIIKALAEHNADLAEKLIRQHRLGHMRNLQNRENLNSH